MDQLAAQNHFFGAELGLRGEYRWSRFFLTAEARAALGGTVQVLNLQRNTTALPAMPVMPAFSPPLLPPSVGAGYGWTTQSNTLAANSSQHFYTGAFGFVPEGMLRLGCQLTPHLRVSLGYTFIWWNNVVRPGDQWNGVVGDYTRGQFSWSNLWNDMRRPFDSLQHSDFWVQGITTGLELRY